MAIGKCPRSSLTAATLHGAGVGAGSRALSRRHRRSPRLSAEAAVESRQARSGLPVSSTSVLLSDTRVKVNLGQTFSVESNVLAFIVIVPVEALK